MYKVMLVDDEPLVREFLRFHFNCHHPEWEIAAEAMDGREALDKFQEGPVDLVITDIKMPVMNGIELSKHLKQLDPSLHIIILSGYDEFTLAREAIRYGVRNYLLKPVVDEELIENINAVTSLLARNYIESLAFFTQNSISNDSRAQVVKQFLKAVVSENYVEIKTLYPLIYRLKVPLIETEGVILMLDLDEACMIRKGIPVSDFPIFRFILQQIASEISAEAGHGHVFLDENQVTCILLSGEDQTHILHRCKELYRLVADAIAGHTGIKVSGALGTMENELFELQNSHTAASRNILYRLYAETADLFEQTLDLQRTDSLRSLEMTLISIRGALYDQNELACSVALKHYIDQMPTRTPQDIVKFGIHLIKSAKHGKRDPIHYTADRAYRQLERIDQEQTSAWSTDAILTVYRSVVDGLIDSGELSKPAADDEYDVAGRAKAYIYAHYSEPLSLALLADKLGVSPGYLSSTFHKTFQESYIKFLTRVRMEQAAKLLKHYPHEKVYDVAEKVGYVGVKHFSHVFKQYYQIPPGEYQEIHSSK